MLYSPRSAVNITSTTNRSTNQIAGNSLFSSEIILNDDSTRILVFEMWFGIDEF